jgi:hypothetical protein
MASSRWKRFAFFEKNALSLPSEVLEDLIPVGESSSSKVTTSSGSRSNSRRSISNKSISELSSSETSNDRVNLVVTTAALPLDSKPTNYNNNNNIHNASNNANNANSDYAIALNDMWSSVTACNPMEGFPASGMTSNNFNQTNNIHLPSQAQSFEDDSNVVSSGTAVDGLVLAFVTSCDTDRVHCFDISVRCNNNSKHKEGGAGSNNNNNNAPNDSTIVSSSGTKTNTTGKSGKKNNDLEDLDGWRGYLAPMKQHKPQQQAATATSTAAGTATAANSNSNGNDAGASQRSTEEQRIIGDNMGGINANNNEGTRKEGIVGIATCRASSGHKPIHMACITATNLVVCVDPHLYLSW